LRYGSDEAATGLKVEASIADIASEMRRTEPKDQYLLGFNWPPDRDDPVRVLGDDVTAKEL
jgi:hypothetical protein